MPKLDEVKGAINDLEDILKLPRKNSQETYKDPGLDKRSRKRLENMLLFMQTDDHINEQPDNTTNAWMQTSIDAAWNVGYIKKGSKKLGEKSKAAP